MKKFIKKKRLEKEDEEPIKKSLGFSKGGSELYKYDKASEFEPVIGGDSNLDAIDDHIKKYLGDVDEVIHEIVSDAVHIDLHLVAPNIKNNFRILITSGMSDRPMHPPDRVKECQYTELMLFLPSDWPLDKESFKDNNVYWPIEQLRRLARFPHKFNTWLWDGHTIPNYDPPSPYSDNTKLCCALLARPPLAPPEFLILKSNDDLEINFFALYFIYEEEMEFKLEYGTEALLQLFEENNISEILDINRKNVCLENNQ
ncbi:MAG TPA: suppressor of fused domain protein [Candidatus Lokiarchaeia archaeon]